jgi:endonuclease YncB( thermonuclease family)
MSILVYACWVAISAALTLVATGPPRAAPISPPAFEAEVVGVHDGDTLTALTDDLRTIKVRLENIDCPELGQPFGRWAKTVLSDLVYRHRVIITPRATDRYGRTVARVSTMEGVAIDAELVGQGACRVYLAYNHDNTLPSIEEEARNAHRGLWADTNSAPPWEWRREKHH